MAVEQNISRYTCDRCGKVDYYPQGTQPSGWMTVNRYTVDRVNVSRTLCSGCYEKYKSIAAEHDGEFNAFMAEGGDE